MNLIGKKVLLRELRDTDMPLLNKLINSPNIEKYIVGWSKPVTMSEQISWFQNLKSDANIRYIISDKDDNNSYGTGIISRIDNKNRTCSIDIKIDEDCHNNGYGKETISLLINYIFNELNLNRIAVNILDYNIGSQKIFEANGFIKEGEQRQAIYKNGKYNNLFIYALTKEDYLSERNR